MFKKSKVWIDLRRNPIASNFKIFSGHCIVDPSVGGNWSRCQLYLWWRSGLQRVIPCDDVSWGVPFSLHTKWNLKSTRFLRLHHTSAVLSRSVEALSRWFCRKNNSQTVFLNQLKFQCFFVLWQGSYSQEMEGKRGNYINCKTGAIRHMWPKSGQKFLLRREKEIWICGLIYLQQRFSDVLCRKCLVLLQLKIDIGAIFCACFVQNAPVFLCLGEAADLWLTPGWHSQDAVKFPWGHGDGE